jgi:hypothetical protein
VTGSALGRIQREDVRRLLTERGWTEVYANGPLRKGEVTWAPLGRLRESVLGLHVDDPRQHPDLLIEFSPQIPARVIVAACEAAAGDRVEAQVRGAVAA